MVLAVCHYGLMRSVPTRTRPTSDRKGLSKIIIQGKLYLCYVINVKIWPLLKYKTIGDSSASCQISSFSISRLTVGVTSVAMLLSCILTTIHSPANLHQLSMYNLPKYTFYLKRVRRARVQISGQVGQPSLSYPRGR